ncbi:MAG: hypothetical protein NTU49_00395, partial [Gammaproteobacteria bacterium]|nr:hypothetical protein [Gammaproteobacteria bacterium]
MKKSDYKQLLKQDNQLLFSKIAIKPDSCFHSWLSHQLQQRFDYYCCESWQDLNRMNKAITLQGQIKTAGERHEKDDRYAIADRSRYILGWSNQKKIEAFELNRKKLQIQGDALLATFTQLSNQQKKMMLYRDIYRDLTHISDYSDIDYRPIVNKIQALLDERAHIEKSSTVLQSLQQQLLTIQQTIKTQAIQRDQMIGDQGRLDEQLKQVCHHYTEAEQQYNSVNHAIFTQFHALLSQATEDALGDKIIRLNNIDQQQTQVRQHVQQKIDGLDKKCKRLTENIIATMQAFKKDYPAETQEIDANIAAAYEYQAILNRLTQDDLPKHESKFKTLLKENTINGIALLQNELNKEKQEIEGKIAHINLSLHDIEYNPGTFIRL